jgi:glycine/sarcosine N-methyltransferase
VSSERFYDDLAEYYDLIYENWDASMARQGDALAGVIREYLPPSGDLSPRILDVAAGIGTQSLPLATRGFRVTARDVSPKAIARLAREGAERGLVIDCGVADMRTVRGTVSAEFEAVICCDNSLPHLLTDEDILLALSQFRESLAVGGVFVCSVRDYDRIDRSAPARRDYGDRRRGDRVFRLWQEWRWVSASHYDVTLVVEEHAAGTPIERVRTVTRYYAVGIPRLLGLMSQSGLTSCERRDGVIHQPLLIGRRE